MRAGPCDFDSIASIQIEGCLTRVRVNGYANFSTRKIKESENIPPYVPKVRVQAMNFSTTARMRARCAPNKLDKAMSQVRLLLQGKLPGYAERANARLQKRMRSMSCEMRDELSRINQSKIWK